MTELLFQSVSCELGRNQILDDVSSRVGSGELVVLLGPNGAGKTTLIRAGVGLLSNYQGNITLDGVPPNQLAAVERSRKISYLPQSRPMAWPIDVETTVALGRFAHGVSLGRLSDLDNAAVDDALVACDLEHLRNRRVDTLSGGELARVHCARAFASQAPLLIADEPIAALDPKHQFAVMTMIRNFVNQGAGALIVLHDVSLAAQFADRLIWLKAGKVIADGPVEETLTASMMLDVYEVSAEVSATDGKLSVAITGIQE